MAQERPADQLIASLRNPRAYSHPVDEIQVIETHISWVLLTGPYAYKIKKPVNLGFVDFSTLQKRYFYCQEEIRLNGRLAPGYYLGVIPITGNESSPTLAGPGRPLEYAVQMKQFPQERLLSRVLDRGKLLPGHIDDLAHQVADFHRRIEVAGSETRFGTPEKIHQPVEENFHYLIPAAGNEPIRLQVRKLQAWSQAEFQAREAEFLSRRQQGAIRECHGDMHLGNMVLENNSIVIFDCIEFNEVFRWIDVMDETAFLVMDLADRGHPNLAHRFLNAYLEITGDYSGLTVLPFYRVYRALVRAKVAGIRLDQPGLEEQARAEMVAQFQSYLDLAEQETQPPRPLLIITHGFSGSGKTTGTQDLLEDLGAVRIRSDVERKRLFGIAPDTRTGSRVAQGIYSGEATRKTYDYLLEQAKIALQAGFSVIMDATFLKRQHRQMFRQLAEQRRIPFIILDFSAPEALLRERIASRSQARCDASEADEEVLTRQIGSSEPLTLDELAVTIPVTSSDPQHVLQQIREKGI